MPLYLANFNSRIQVQYLGLCDQVRRSVGALREVIPHVSNKVKVECDQQAFLYDTGKQDLG